MSRKITAYGRKLKRTGNPRNIAAWSNVVSMCRPYGDDVPVVIPGLIEGTQSVADMAKLKAVAAFDELRAGRLPPSNESAFDEMSIALSLACIRAGQIGGEVVAENPALVLLVAGNQVLRKVLNRRRKFGKWELIPSEVSDLANAIGAYEEIFQASSPAQMTRAEEIQREWLKGQVLETVN